jgi:hypothetical protein
MRVQNMTSGWLRIRQVDVRWQVNMPSSRRGKPLSILPRRDAKGPNEGGAHLFFPGKAAASGNSFDAIGGLLQAATRYINANRFYGFRGRAATRLRIDSCEVSGAHVYQSRQCLDSEIGVQMLHNPLLKFGEPV